MEGLAEFFGIPLVQAVEIDLQHFLDFGDVGTHLAFLLGS
jgi:hypothetical protein